MNVWDSVSPTKRNARSPGLSGPSTFKRTLRLQPHQASPFPLLTMSRIPVLGVQEGAYRLRPRNLYRSPAAPASAERRGIPTPQVRGLLVDWQRLAETGVLQSLSSFNLGRGLRLPGNVPRVAHVNRGGASIAWKTVTDVMGSLSQPASGGPPPAAEGVVGCRSAPKVGSGCSLSTSGSQGSPDSLVLREEGWRNLDFRV